MTLDIESVDPDELIILKSISGLTPGDLTLFTGDFARDGGYYQGRRAIARNPVFNFKINPNYAMDIDVSDARDILYRQFYDPMPNSDGLQVLLKDDRRPDRYFYCYAEKWDGDIFTDKPAASISTICVDPYLRSADETTRSNPGGWLSVPVSYDGTADTGLSMTLKVVSPTTQIVVENNGVPMTLVKASGFAVDDIIEINTLLGSRQVLLNGVDYMALMTGSYWVYLTQAANIMRVYGSAPGDGKVVMTDYSYRSAWRGV